MAKDQNLTPALPRGRPAAQPAEPRKRRIGLIEFAREVRAEARKVTWTSRRETWIMSVMVFIMVLLTAFFFTAIEVALNHIMPLIFKLGA